jgi:hypothetical protein
MTSEDLPETMRQHAEDAVRYAHGTHNARLDYSKESIARVETIIARIHHYIPQNRIAKWIRSGPSDAEIDQLCHMLGGYIGEVYRRAKGGEWAHNDEMHAVGIVRDDGWVFPMVKVRQRLGHGPGDDLYRYFQAVLDAP